jgi:hypothetical protein
MRVAKLAASSARANNTVYHAILLSYSLFAKRRQVQVKVYDVCHTGKAAHLNADDRLLRNLRLSPHPTTMTMISGILLVSSRTVVPSPFRLCHKQEDTSLTSSLKKSLEARNHGSGSWHKPV